MKTTGWIKLHRKITEWEWYSDPNVFRLFMHLLLTANYQDTKWKGIDLKRGQLVTGRKKLSEETGLSVQEVRTAMDKLKSTSEITITSTSKFSVVSVCNYDKYQDDSCDDQPAKQPASHTTSNKRATTVKEIKEIKEEKNNKPAANVFDFSLLPSVFRREVLGAFVEHRKVLGKKLTPYALELVCKNALRCQEQYGIDPNDAIDTAIASGWQTCKPEYFANHKTVERKAEARCHVCVHQRAEVCVKKPEEKRVNCAYFEEAKQA